MREAAISHKNTNEYIYALSRKKLVVRLYAAKGDLKSCKLIYWPRTDTSIEGRVNKLLVKKYSDATVDYFETEVEFAKIARYTKYYFELEDAAGVTRYLTAYGMERETPESHYFEYLYANDDDAVRIPDWCKGQIYYQIFPERFKNGDTGNDPKGCVTWDTLPTRDNFMGGDLAGIIEKLDYLEDLGIDCLYLTPIFKGDFNHKYATTDYFEIDEIFGTKKDLKLLVNKCHENGMKLILDGVFNHCGISFLPFKDVLEKQEDSRYKDWFYITEFPLKISHHNYECVGAYKWMPKLRTSNPEVQEFILKVMEYWIIETGIDGWRLDVADEVDFHVWQKARFLLKRKYPEIILIGETWGYGRRLLSGDQMDAVMNYVFRDAVLDFIAWNKMNATEFGYRINQMLGAFPEPMNQAMYNLLDSHDTPRCLYECHGDVQKLKLATTIQFMIPGSPAIYYGDEIGMTGDNDPDCRRTMQWDESVWNHDLLHWYQTLIRIRKSERLLQKGEFATCYANKQVYGFERKGEDESIQVYINNSSEQKEIIFSQDVNVESIEVLASSTDNQNLPECVKVESLTLEAYSAKIIKIKRRKLS